MRKLAENARLVRAALLAAVEDVGPAAVALSGGIDSASILAACLAIGRKPDCYTFNLSPGESADLKVARSMCEAFGLELRVAPILRHPDTLARDLRWVVPYAAAYMGLAYEVHKPKLVKVPIQCLHAMSYVAALALEYKVGTMMSGFCADGYYGSNRSMHVMLQREGFAAWDAYRRKYLVHPTNADLLVRKWFADVGVDLIDVWAHPEVQKVMLAMGPAELHKPYVKAVAVHAFPEFWSRGRWVRENQSLQVVGGIREWHDTMLGDPENEGAASILAVYSKFLRGTQNGRATGGGRDSRGRPIHGPANVDV